MKNIEKMERYAKISCEMVPTDDKDVVEAQVELFGNINGLLNAFEALSTNLFKQISAEEGKRKGTALYAMVQMKVLNNLGIDPAEEMEKAKARISKRNLIKSIFSQMDEQEEGMEK